MSEDTDTISLAGVPPATPVPPVPTPTPGIRDEPSGPPEAAKTLPDPDESRTEAMRQRAAELKIVQGQLDDLAAIVASLARVSEPGYRKHVAEVLIRHAENMYAEQILVDLGLMPESERRY